MSNGQSPQPHDIPRNKERCLLIYIIYSKIIILIISSKVTSYYCFPIHIYSQCNDQLQCSEIYNTRVTLQEITLNISSAKSAIEITCFNNISVSYHLILIYCILLYIYIHMLYNSEIVSRAGIYPNRGLQTILKYINL